MKNSAESKDSNGTIAIKVHHVSKTFRLPHEKQNSLKSIFVNIFTRRRFEKQQVLHDVDFEVKKGEFFGIVGRNGSGKSTLLKLLAGIYSPSKGYIHVNGLLTPFIELGVGFNPELTGRENVYLNGALLGFSRKEMSAMYNDIVKFAELERFMDQKLKNYSSGMQVRLAFSIAIRAQSDILLIDEVLAVGDQSFQEKCFRYFSEVKKTGKTVVFVTHDMSNVERFCDRVLVLDKSFKDNGVFTVREAVKRYNSLNHPRTEPSEEAKETENEPNTSREFYIKKVTLLNENGEPKTSFMSGEAMTIRVETGLSAKTDLTEDTPIVLGLAIHDNDNINLAGPNSLHAKLTVGQGTYEYVIDKLPFNMGEYYLTVALFDQYVGVKYDLIDKGISFFVNTDDVYYGKTILNGTWR